MSKKQEQQTIQIPQTVTVELSRPVKHQKTLVRGTTFTVVPDGQGAEVDDISKTIWKSRADTLIASLSNQKGIRA